MEGVTAISRPYCRGSSNQFAVASFPHLDLLLEILQDFLSPGCDACALLVAKLSWQVLDPAFGQTHDPRGLGECACGFFRMLREYPRMKPHSQGSPL